MTFNNPIVAGQELIRSSMRSATYVDSSEGGVGEGWSINRNGTADFYNLTTRGSTSGPVGSYDTLIANNEFIYKGDALSNSLDNRERGVIAYHERTTVSSVVAIGVTAAVMRVSAVTEVGRKYRIFAGGGVYLNSATPGHISVQVRATTNGSEPTLSTPVLQQVGPYVPSGGFVVDFTVERYYVATTTSLKLLLTFKPNTPASVTGAMWGSADWPSFMGVEDLGKTLILSGINDDGTSTPPKSWREFFIGATDSRSYEGDGTSLAAAGSTYMYSGDIGVDGNRRSACWFDYSTTSGMASVPLVDISYCDVYLYYDHWYYSTGGNAFIGHHESASVTSSQPASWYPRQKTVAWEGRDIGKWINVKDMSSIMSALNTGAFRGLALGDTPSSNLLDYGYALGYAGASGNRPHMRAGYYK